MSQSHPPAASWDRFADVVLPNIGLPTLAHHIQSTCPEFPADRVRYWATQFNDMNDDLDARFADEDGEWTDDERDGIWYDRMKLIALDCRDEANLPLPGEISSEN